MDAEGRIDCLLSERESWSERAEYISPKWSGMPIGKEVKDKISICLAHIVKLEAEIDREIDRAVEIRREIKRAISKIHSAKIRLVMEQKYIAGRTCETIAESMHYDVRHIYRLHKKGIDLLDV